MEAAELREGTVPRARSACAPPWPTRSTRWPSACSTRWACPRWSSWPPAPGITTPMPPDVGLSLALGVEQRDPAGAGQRLCHLRRRRHLPEGPPGQRDRGRGAAQRRRAGAGAAPGDRLPGGLAHAQRGGGGHRPCGGRAPPPAAGGQDRHLQRQARRLVRGLLARTCWPRSGWASTTASRWARARPAAAPRCRSGPSSWPRRWPTDRSKDFTAPPGIEVARIDPSTGLLPPPGVEGIEEMFLAGTAPRETTVTPEESSKADQLLFGSTPPAPTPPPPPSP